MVGRGLVDSAAVDLFAVAIVDTFVDGDTRSGGMTVFIQECSDLISGAGSQELLAALYQFLETSKEFPESEDEGLNGVRLNRHGVFHVPR